MGHYLGSAMPGLRRRTRFISMLNGSALALGAAALLVPSVAGASVRPSFRSPSTVYTETNQTSGNDVLAFHANANGTLTQFASYATGGIGTGTSPNSQGGVTLGDDGHLLAVVNGGSNSVSVFAVSANGSLYLLATQASGGTDPISVAIDGSWIYSLNAGSTSPAVAPSVGGFNLLWPSAAVTQSLSSGAKSPEDVGVSPNGRELVVTEKASSTIDVFSLSWFGAIGSPVTTSLANGPGPYGFSFLPDGNLVVSEAAFGGLATFSINPNDTLTQLSQVSDGQAAPCWTALAFNGSEVFTTNAHNGTISAFWIGWRGQLALINPAVQATVGTAGDTDIAVASNGVLYTSIQPTVTGSWLTPTGGLGTTETAASGFPAGTFGLAAS